MKENKRGGKRRTSLVALLTKRRHSCVFKEFGSFGIAVALFPYTMGLATTLRSRSNFVVEAMLSFLGNVSVSKDTFE